MVDVNPENQPAILDDDVIEHVLVLDNNPQLDDALIGRLQYDLATRIHPYEAIARRYGLASVAGLYAYLRAHPLILVEAKKIRALFESGENTEERVRKLFLHATESLIPDMHNLARDTRTPISARVDAFKQIQRGAAMDGPARDAGLKGNGPAGTAFVLNINYRNGQSTRIAGTTVLDADDIPAPSQQMSLEDDSEFDEEV